RDAHDAAVAGGERRRVEAVVAGGGHQDDVLRPRVVDRVLEVLTEAGTAEGHHDDVGAVIRRPYDPGDDIAVLPESVRIEHRHRHDSYAAVGNAGDPLERVRLCGHDSGNPGAVPARIGGSRGPVENRDSGNHVRGQMGGLRAHA